MRIIIASLLLVLLLSCGSEQRQHSKDLYPNRHYHYVHIDTAVYESHGRYYVPVYSSIYAGSGEREYLLSATLSVRNTSFSDTIYISHIDYYDSEGKLLKKYLDSAVLLKPMASLEVVVRHDEKLGGAGANFVVNSLGKDSLNEPFIQTIMTSNDLRAAFTANAIKMQVRSH